MIQRQQIFNRSYIKSGDNNKYLNDSNIMAYNITDGFIEIEKIYGSRFIRDHILISKIK